MIAPPPLHALTRRTAGIVRSYRALEHPVTGQGTRHDREDLWVARATHISWRTREPARPALAAPAALHMRPNLPCALAWMLCAALRRRAAAAAA